MNASWWVARSAQLAGLALRREPGEDDFWKASMRAFPPRAEDPMNESLGNKAPGFQKRPDHRITTKPAGVRVRVRFKGEVIADSPDAIAMEEGQYPPVYYLPRKDVKMQRLARTAHSTHCPFKGDASYFSLVNGPENAVWSYEQPYDEMAAIKGMLAFYPDKVDAIDLVRE
jgi:uncharacterized protein (DUF427 family)